ncbi:MAG: DNA polymerase III subunit epsilon [Burkholderiales bacterium]|nr:DNA polymerase III subunit epsilon [Burkholderiales bacterium]
MSAARPVDRAALVAAALPALVFAGLLAAALGLLAATLPPEHRAQVWAAVEPNLAIVVMVWFFASLAAGVLVHKAWVRFAAAPGRLAERVRVLLSADPAAGATAPGQDDAGLALLDAGEGVSEDSIALTAAVAALALQRDALRREIGERIAEGSREVEQEKGRLAALMAELAQSVVVCNLDGRILLFNARARLQFRALLAAPAGAGATSPIGGAEPIGLGRSIYGVLDRRLVAHALEAVQQRLARGAAHPSAQFVTPTKSGQLLRVQLAPVKEPGPAPGTGSPPVLNGFVLMLENITQEMAEERARERLLHTLTEGSRGSIGNLQAAVELLEDPGLDAPTRERFLGVIREEIGALARRLDEAAAQSASALEQRWPLEDMLGSDFVAAAVRRLHGQGGLAAEAGSVDADLWLKVESYSLIQALLHLATRLVQAYDVPRVTLRLADAEHQGVRRAQLDLAFPVAAMSTETVVGWETEPLQSDEGEASGTLTLRDVVQRHGGAFWFERERARQEGRFRFLLPLAGVAGVAGGAGGAGEGAMLEASAVLRHDSRPEFYDFNLFAARAMQPGDALGEQLLADLSYTVFDTETTGLRPSEGDRIIQIGATRIVAARLRRQETFDQLVNPERELSEAGIAIHGIRPEMLQGQPRLAEVLPAFHDFAHDTVLVAHNAAFDMRFLQLAEAATGVRFEQPVLDTLLLSAVVHPKQDNHSLEAIAGRLGVTVLGRHTALGDAMVTAEVFMKLVPLLQGMGITTLGEALSASEETYLARLRY